MTTTPLRLTVIVGSTRSGRFAPTVTAWFAELAGAREDLDVRVVDLAEAWLPDVLDLDGARPPAVSALTPWLADADAFVVVTPEYNHSFPAALKNAIDWYLDEWRAKAVGYVSYGGLSGGVRAVEALRGVFDEVHATSVRTAVAVANYWELVDDAGRWRPAKVHEQAVTEMLDQLVWWADALRAQRARVPYPRDAA